MPGRGRPRKDKGPDTNCIPEETKGPGLPSDPEKVFSEEPQNGASKERKPKKPRQTNKTAEKPPVQSSGNPDSKTAPVKGLNVKTCAARAKTKQAAGEMVKTQMEPATNTMEDSLQTTKGKKMPHVPPEARVAQGRGKDKVDVTLNKTLEKLKIRKNSRSDSAEVINNIIQHILQHLRKNTERFKEVEEPLRTGSYYEHLKVSQSKFHPASSSLYIVALYNKTFFFLTQISEPDEFDVMMPIPVDRVNIMPFGDNGAFYSVALKRGSGSLKKFQVNDTLSAYEMLKDFREEVKKSVKGFEGWCHEDSFLVVTLLELVLGL